MAGIDVTWPFTGLTATIDGKVAGVMGVHRFGIHNWVYFNVFDARLRQPFFLHRLALNGLDSCDKLGFGPIYSICDHTEPNARRWHGALGFREIEDTERDEEVRICEAHNKRGAWIR